MGTLAQGLDCEAEQVIRPEHGPWYLPSSGNARRPLGFSLTVDWLMPDVTEFCPACHACLDASAVHLWDGRDHCRDCVDEECSALADHAERNPSLETRCHYPFWRTWTKFMVLFHAAAAVWVGIPVAFHLLFPFPEQRPARPPPDLTPLEWMFGILFCAGLAFVVFALFCGAIALGGWLGGSASVCDGTVSFDGRLEAELSDLTWAIQPRENMTWSQRLYLVPGHAALLFARPRWSRERWWFRASVSAEDTEIWRGFLQLSGAHMDLPLRQPTNRDSFWETGLIFFAFPLLYVAGMTLARTLPGLLAFLPLDEQMAKLAAFSLFIPGVPLIFLYVAFTAGIRSQIPSLRADMVRQSRSIKWVCLGLGVLAAAHFRRGATPLVACFGQLTDLVRHGIHVWIAPAVQIPQGLAS